MNDGAPVMEHPIFLILSPSKDATPSIQPSEPCCVGG
jgi:hypothetical protein